MYPQTSNPECTSEHVESQEELAIAFTLSEKVASHNYYVKSIQEYILAETFQLVKPYQLSGTTLSPTVISTTPRLQ